MDVLRMLALDLKLAFNRAVKMHVFIRLTKSKEY